MKRGFWVLLTVAVLCCSPLLPAATIVFTGSLAGSNENPVNASPGTGTALVTYDSAAHTLDFDVHFMNLLSTTTAAHIHCCVAPPGNVGVAVTPGTLPGFPLGVMSGNYMQSVDLTNPANYTANFLNNFGGGTASGAESALIAGMLGGQAYFNIHTAAPGGFPGGEIRDFLQAVPEPGTLALLSLGLAGLGAWKRRRA